MIRRTLSDSSRRDAAKGNRKRIARSGQKRRLLMENLEGRRLLASDTAFTPVPVDPALFAAQLPRNVGTVTAMQIGENETAGVRGGNDTIATAQVLPLGTLASQEDTIDVSGSLNISFNSQNQIISDVDYFAVDLQAGDILDIALIGAQGNFSVSYGPGTQAPGRFWFGTDSNQSLLDPVTGEVLYAKGSPLQTLGSAVGAQVVPETGRYYIGLAPAAVSANYTMGLRAYRPVIEQAPLGAQQIMYLDFDGGFYPSSEISGSTLPLGMVRFDRLVDNLGVLGFTNPTQVDGDLLQQQILAEVRDHYDTITVYGNNGDYDETGIGGQYGITIVSSLECPEFGDRSACAVGNTDLTNNPLVTRVMVGGLVSNTGIDGVYGIAESVDVGNFRPGEITTVVLDQISALTTTIPRSPAVSELDVISKFLGGVISHEAGHTFGERHTSPNNGTDNIMDAGGVAQALIDNLVGPGPDGIVGTVDDVAPIFAREDMFELAEGFFGYTRTAASLSFELSTGRATSTITGRVFNDANRDGAFNGDAGLAGITVYADLDGDRVLDATEPSSVSAADGSYRLDVAPGVTYTVVAQTPAQYVASTSTERSATAGTTDLNFGFTKVVSDVTGIKFADLNGNGQFDTNEQGLEGVYIYLDLDGDDRPDLGEPSDVTDANGYYSIDFPGPGTYTIREVVEAGFQQTFPASGEHIVTYDGIGLTDNYNFGNLPSRDYGDAPDTYLTSVAAGGPSHGISQAVGLGTLVDREVDGFPTATALGDDNNNVDDEDGIQLLSPLGPGGTATIQVNARNTSGQPAYLQGWIDFNANGVFDASEQVITNANVAAGLSNVTVSVPANAVIGSTYARFRYSPTAGIGPAGDADLGEVEDYQFDILQQASVANDDTFTVSRNSLSNELDVLGNDFQSSLTELTVVTLNTNGTSGVVTIAGDGKSVFYTPRNGFTGRDVFQYTVQDQAGNRYSAEAVVTVSFQSNVPIAVDDTFDIPQGSTNRPLNVLDNDVPSIAGGIRIVSVTAGDQGGTVTMEGGGQTIRYTPVAGFTGTEQFTYSIQDANGVTSQATVTVNSQPGARADDLVDFTIGIYDVTNNQPISSVQVGQEFYVRVFVQELNNQVFDPEGVASAFLDLLYSDGLVATQDTMSGDAFGFDITFGPNFQGSGFQLGDASIPGVIDEVGAVQPIPGDGNLIQHSDPAELFTLTMTAVSPGVAVFAADPADTAVAETILVGEDTALTPAQQRLGRTELTIFPQSDNFASAIDDAFMVGTDSNGVVISAANGPNTLDVLDNDIFGPTNSLLERGIGIDASLGTVSFDDNGTPSDLTDDFVTYFANSNASGYDRFTYYIVSGDGVRSVAEVTLAIGDAAGDDDLVEVSFGLVDQLGNSIASVNSGDTFGVQVFVEDLRSAIDGNTFVFASYMDMLYDSGVLSPGSVPTGSRFDFDVAFDSDFDASAGVGTAARDGIIDEFGSLLRQTVAESGSVAEPNLMATVYFTAGPVASTTVTRVKASPADSSPFQDTLLFDRDQPVPVSQIRYDVLDITINPVSSLQNQAMPEDVNNDGIVTPSDALSVINALGRLGEGEQADSGSFTDVNGDFQTSPIDALMVINYLAVQIASEGGEGESVGSGLTASNDSAITDLSGSVGLMTSDADDDDDDFLSLLAQDQSSLA
ncbi:Ig-like domain-containing protein [Stieleria sp. JC731]|uniref:Ig-like domain-containing protein n=1 Tax=Pirellulaceae TaxID=2691357 RepID=UPI001E5CA287|nr:Ig-like domain-containing protein [Stieleria sp. JC731]MCC9601398.1 Ig-like domain-containing protein [Stieleria sp. JC731]